MSTASASLKPPSYTYEISVCPSKLTKRLDLAGAPVSKSQDDLHRLLSYPMGFFFLSTCCGTMFLFSPNICVVFFQRFFGSWSRQKVSNVSNTTGSRTAAKVLSQRAEAYLCGFGTDPLAVQFLKYVPMLGPPLFWNCAAFFYLWGLKMRWKVSRVLSLPMEEKFGLPFDGTMYVHTRTAWLDDVCDAFFKKQLILKKQKRVNLVLLGAGFDSRCYRLTTPEGLEVKKFEVDAPGTQTRKLEVLTKAGVDTSGVTFVSCNFAEQSWAERLKSAGIDLSIPSCFVWEGVTYYLPKEAVTHALGQGIEDLVRSTGLQTAEHLLSLQLVSRFVPKKWGGVPAARLGPFGGFVVARRP
uniref:S-adenosyl-L-methionine-dependent methyltransferase n=1 Tax=Chromera velia CCMP2878 TaxID=1169474 RepID=A0A0G4GD77_9ALVE|eukprot:Cvel_4544.t1-p1 / transcript=Cvel_4544.t1 / gene=Cvel_4544 / organism=Chromera_velia_CCMP2878 / gene_product=Putative S-adenosyl-L-methionine-dependent, putative / transcript_product=Putative S-adenosyl-L-methionine-dependent, putative / location=Cvel_scaffold199:46727-49761(+) / protein_length=353 / sequence_SO=supercontig / SO=protein_coding / is_pseudo=false